MGDQRLQAIVNTTDGFKLAEVDLEIRGPGEFFGTRQSGEPELKLVNLRDRDLLETARTQAENVLAGDPELSTASVAGAKSGCLLEESRWWRCELDQFTMTIALYPGTFDPFHNGHLDIATRALALFDELIIGVYDQPDKKLLFTHDERIALVKECMRELGVDGRARVVGYSGLTVAFAQADRRADAWCAACATAWTSTSSCRWRRPITGWLKMSRSCACSPTRPTTFLSATLIRQITNLGGDVTALVPACVAKALMKKQCGG